MHKVKMLVMLIIVVMLSGCAGALSKLAEMLPDTSATQIALNTTQTLSAAIQLKDNYLDAREKVYTNIETFTADDRQTLLIASQDVESFYTSIIELSRSKERGDIYVNTNEFLMLLETVRASSARIISVLDTGSASFDSDARASYYVARQNYLTLSAQIDRVLQSGNRREMASMMIRVIRSASRLALVVSQ
jgi:hypothetical protein